jgi:peroxiredoxin
MRIISPRQMAGTAILAGIVATALPLGIVMVVRKTTPPKPLPSLNRALSPGPGKHFTGVVQYDVLANLLADDRRQTAQNWLRELIDSKGAFRVPSQPHPLLGKPAPDFTLGSVEGKRWGLGRHVEQGTVILVFYLGYNCPACVHDLIQINADIDRFHALGAEVVAISGDAAETTRDRYAKFGALKFPVLSDPGHVVATLYGACRPKTPRQDEELLHGTFVIGRDRVVEWAYSAAALPFCDENALLSELLARRVDANANANANANAGATPPATATVPREKKP